MNGSSPISLLPWKPKSAPGAARIEFHARPRRHIGCIGKLRRWSRNVSCHGESAPTRRLMPRGTACCVHPGMSHSFSLQLANMS